MDWLKQYQLFLFDFDGLLVNTEELHYEAYKLMCQQRGFHLNWDFEFYCGIAHHSAEGLELQIYADIPGLKKMEPDWKVLYQEKKQAYLDLINRGAVELMPGAEELLIALQQANVNRAVVTHSLEELITAIRRQLPLLDTIPHWITREHYKQPKPSSECYLKAIEMLAKEDDNVIGFEDTPRGITALAGTRATLVFVSTLNYVDLPPQAIQVSSLKMFR